MDFFGGLAQTERVPGRMNLVTAEHLLINTRGYRSKIPKEFALAFPEQEVSLVS